MAILEKPLESCTLKYLDKTFKTREVINLPSLDAWLAQTATAGESADASDFEQQALLRSQKTLAFNVHDWNEHELDSHFIGPLFALVDFSTPYFNHFAQRTIEATVDGVLLYGRPDGMVASGRREPEQPYFAFQEYKRNLDPDGDPAGQCLAAMLVGQTLSTTPDQPVYGCFVVGSVWRFLTLESNQYAISPDYSALTDDLFAIFRILKALKTIVADRVANSLT